MASIVFIAGRDPRGHTGCSHGVYMRTHARAALRAGYEAHLVCLGARTECEETDFGTVHSVATAWKTHRQNRIPWHSPLLAERAAAVVRALGCEAAALHAVGVWGHAAAAADARLGGVRALVQGGLHDSSR